ncbi:F-box protein [Senna tora]|uniref:F-box protein n=1 Tax=Senna tora TaxID=362788 RepID=A0A834TD21_9FABA|nr:F-box protein [Senna tora]
MDKFEKGRSISLLDLPESILDCILKRLPPRDLYQMLHVCSWLRSRCRSNDLWENQIKQKWGKVIGPFARKEWQWHITKPNFHNGNGSMGSFAGAWPNIWLASYLQDSKHLTALLSHNFIMAFCFSLETGTFWFPAQIHQGSMLRDALLSYDRTTDTFKARKHDGNWQLLGINIKWDNVRVAPLENSPYVVHVSHCLQNLKPGDYVEIQWRQNRENPFEWCHAVIGHLESCDENENPCQCHYSEMLVVEPKQYAHVSHMKRIMLSRKECGEEGVSYMRRIMLSRKTSGEQSDTSGGFYGGIRMLQNHEEIEIWERLFLDQYQGTARNLTIEV